MPDQIRLPAKEVLAEQAYLVARGVRPLSLAGHCQLLVDGSTLLLRVATHLERYCIANVVPFVVDHGDGVASYGYSGARWALDLYEWAVKNPSVPQEQRHRIIGLLLGFPAIEARNRLLEDPAAQVRQENRGLGLEPPAVRQGVHQVGLEASVHTLLPGQLAVVVLDGVKRLSKVGGVVGSENRVLDPPPANAGARENRPGAA